MLLYAKSTDSTCSLKYFPFQSTSTKFILSSAPFLYSRSSCAVCRVNIAGYHFVFTHDPTLFVFCLVLKEPSHEGKATLLDVGLPSNGVEDRISTAADEGQSRGHCTTVLRDMVQPADKQNI